MKRVFILLSLVLLLARGASAQFTPLCTVTGTIYDGLGQPAANTPVTIVKVLKSGAVFSSISRTVSSNASGVVTLTLPQNSIAYVYARAYIGSLNLAETGGVALTIPAASTATLESLGAAVTIPTTGLTLKDEGVSLATLISTINVVGTGFSVAQTSPGVAELNLTGGGGSITVREVDGAPLINPTTILEFLQSSGFVVTDQTGGVARVDLAAVPYAKLNLGSSIVNADVAAGAAIAYSKLNLTGAILNADLAGSIADTKLLTIATAGKVADSALSTNVSLLGSSISLTTEVTGILPLANGGSGADLSATGGANQFVKQSSLGAVFTVGSIADADVPDTITLTNITQITTRSHTSLTDIGTNTHAAIDTHIAAANPHSGSAASGANTDITSLVLNNTGLNIKDTGGDHNLIVAYNENATANRTLNILLSNASRSLTISGDATVSGTNTGDQTITLTGDVTGSGTGSFAATIANDAVTLAKMANIATASVIGRNTAATGDPEVLTTLPNGIQDNITRLGTVTLGVWNGTDIAFANFVPATAASKLVGRGSAAGAGDFEEITIGAGLTMTGTTLSTSAGGGTVTHTAGALTANSFVFGNGGDDIKATAAATNGQLLIGSTGVNPVAAALTGTANQITVTNGAGSITLSTPQDIHSGASPSFVGLTLTGAITFPDDIRQTFNPGTVNAGLNVGALAGDPSTPSNGDLWYDSTANELTARINGVNTALGSGGSSGANPTALVGLTAVNGVATTFLRSDGAPALDQAIAPTWTGQHIWSLANSAAVVIGPNGTTNPTARFNTSVASAATGIEITGNAAGSGVTLTALSSGTDENVKILPKGTTGRLQIGSGTDAPSSASTLLYVSNEGNNGLSVRDSANNVEVAMRAAGGVQIGAVTNHPAALIVNNTARLTLGTAALQYNPTGGADTFYINQNAGFLDTVYTIRVGSDDVIGFGSATSIGSALDVGHARNAAGIAEINNGTAGQWGALKSGVRDAGTTTVTNGLTVGHQSTGTPAAGLGSAIQFNINSSTTADQDAARIAALWFDATHATRTADLVFYTVNNAAALAEAGRFTGAGNLDVVGVIKAGSSDTTLTDAAGKILSAALNTVAVGQGGSGATTLTGLVQGNGTSAFTAITDSTTVGQTLRVTGSNTYAWGALDLADTDAITGTLPVGNGGSGAATLTGILKGNGASAFTAATAGTDYTSPSSTESFSNKTIDPEATGNVIGRVDKYWIDAGSNNAGTATTNWDFPTSNSPVAAAINGTNIVEGVLDFADGATDLTAHRKWLLPADFTGTVDVKFRWYSSTTTGDVIWGVATVCRADGETADGAAFNAYSDVTDTTKATTNQVNDAAITGVTITGCAAGEMMYVKIARRLSQAGDTMAGTARLEGIEITPRRNQ